MSETEKPRARPKTEDPRPVKSLSRTETRLVIPPSMDSESSSLLVSRVTAEWVIPRLLEDFLREKGITPRNRFVARTNVKANLDCGAGSLNGQVRQDDRAQDRHSL